MNFLVFALNVLINVPNALGIQINVKHAVELIGISYRLVPALKDFMMTVLAKIVNNVISGAKLA